MEACNDTTGIVINPPKDPTLAERIGMKMDFNEIPISKTDVDGNTVTVIVYGKKGS